MSRGRSREAVKSLYLQSEACVRVQGKNSEWFGVMRGVRQGCTMSPGLFNLVVDSIEVEARESIIGGVHLEGSKMQFLLFADDLVLVAENEEDTKRNVQVLSELMAKWKILEDKLVKAQGDGSTEKEWYMPLGCGQGRD